ncbi:MAG TPA: DUF6770 family protein [Chitinophagaceae bacterium]|jgi:hypothetical protein|nr:DUF6770 family protein [Chitinophagaceae bacterium]
MKKGFAELILLLAVSFTANTQKLSLNDVRSVELRSADAIRRGTDVKGYYFFYVNDKISKNTNEYVLQVTDNSLNRIKDLTYTGTTDLVLQGSSFNGKDIMFQHYLPESFRYEFHVYGADGNKKFMYDREFSSKERMSMRASTSGLTEEFWSTQSYPVPDKGFLVTRKTWVGKALTFIVDFFSSQEKKEWSYTGIWGNGYITPEYLGIINNTALFGVLKISGYNDKTPESSIIGIDLATGRQVFEKTTYTSFNKFYPGGSSLLPDGKMMVFGQYFDQADNIIRDKSAGIGLWIIDEKGDRLQEKYISWNDELGKYLTVKDKGKIDEVGYMFLHDIVQIADGSYYIIGEGYEEAKGDIKDMILVGMDKHFSITSAKTFPKGNKHMKTGALALSTHFSRARQAKALDVYDYKYVQVGADKTSFTVYYSSDDDKTANFINYADGKITTDKISLKTDATNTFVLPAQEGQVLLADYYKKEKRLDLHIEKVH